MSVWKHQPLSVGESCTPPITDPRITRTSPLARTDADGTLPGTVVISIAILRHPSTDVPIHPRRSLPLPPWQS